MLNLWQRTLQYIEGQNAWISSLQSIIAEKEQNYKLLHSLITKEILKELGKITVDVDDAVKIEADVKEECSDDVIDDIQPTQEVQIDAEEVAHFNRLLHYCNRQSKTTTCINDNEETSIGQMNSNVAVIKEDQDGIMEEQDVEQDDINEEQDDINEEQDDINEKQDDINEKQDNIDEEQDDINEKQDEEIKMECESSCDYEDDGNLNENKAVYADIKKYIQQKNNQEETNVDSESNHVIEGTSEKHNDTRMENEAGFDDTNVPADTTYDEQHKYTGEKPFKCSYCDRSFQQSDDLEQHVMKHKRCETPYKCIYCPMWFTHNSSLKSHMYQHTDDKDRLKCINCEKYFNRASDLQKHMRTHTKNPFKCSDCGKSFDIISKWKSHIMRTYTCKKPWKCIHCDKSFSLSYNLRCHMRMHTIKPFKCSNCERSFQQSDDLEEHILKHKLCETPYKCMYCPMSFTDNSSLQSHMYYQHTDDKDRLKCINCEKYFHDASDLQKHMRTHTKNPFKCSDCGKSFDIISKWKTHIMMTNTCKNPLKCPQCDELFSLSYHLRCHMRIHTGEKPFKCEQCSKTFTFFNGLTRHMRIHATKNT